MSGGAHLQAPRRKESETRSRQSHMKGMEGSLSGVDRYSRALRTDADAEEETVDEQMGPRVGDALPDAGGEGEKGADKDRPPTAQPFVEL